MVENDGYFFIYIRYCGFLFTGTAPIMVNQLLLTGRARQSRKIFNTKMRLSVTGNKTVPFQELIFVKLNDECSERIIT